MENYAQEPHLKTLVFAMIKFSQLLLLGLLAKIKCGFAGLQLGEKYYCSITWIVEWALQLLLVSLFLATSLLYNVILDFWYILLFMFR